MNPGRHRDEVLGQLELGDAGPGPELTARARDAHLAAPLRTGDLQRRRVLGRHPVSLDAPTTSPAHFLTRCLPPAASVRAPGYVSPIRGVTRRAISAFTPEIRSAPCRCRRCPPLPAAGRAGAAPPRGDGGLGRRGSHRPGRRYLLAGGHQRGVRRWRQLGRATPTTSSSSTTRGNRGGPVDWSVQYAPPAGNRWAEPKTNLPASIVAGKSYYLIPEAPGAGGTARRCRRLTSADDRHERAGWQGGAGEQPERADLRGDCDSNRSADFVGYGAADYAGAGPGPRPVEHHRPERNAAASNTGNNAADFAVGAPTPRARRRRRWTAPPRPPAARPRRSRTSRALVPLARAARPSSGPGHRHGVPHGSRLLDPAPNAGRGPAPSRASSSSPAPTTVAVGDSVLVTGRSSDSTVPGATQRQPLHQDHPHLGS